MFKKELIQKDVNKPLEWQFNGKIKTHELEITSISFGLSIFGDGESKEAASGSVEKLRLFSIGRDRRVFEYDVHSSSVLGGLVVRT